MTRYLVRRLVQVGITLFLISSLIFVLLHVRPGGPCSTPAIGLFTDRAVSAAPGYVDCVNYYQLDEPVANQYATFLGNVLHGDLGRSITPGNTSVTSILFLHLPATLLLITASFLLQQLIALPLGIFAAVRRYSLFDGAFTILSYLFLSAPAFILGLALLYLFAVRWPLLPPGQADDVLLPVLGTGAWFAMLLAQPALVLGDMLQHLILPAVTLALVGIALDSRFMRASMLQVLHEDYIRTARAKGLPHRSVIFKHAFRNALPPIITNISLYLPALIGTAMVVETVFSYNGIGYTFIRALAQNDSPLAQGIFLVSTGMVLFANLAADLFYGVADPRVRYD